MMRSLRKRAPSWFARRAGSQECLLDQPSSGHQQQSATRPEVVRTKFEMTSLKVRQLLEKGKFQQVVDLLRDCSHDHIRHCLESFPFKILNRYVPKSFTVWETLLMKLHNNEDGYIPEFPYKACDELVLQIGQLLERAGDMPRDNADLIHDCKRVLKKVYMQYNEVLQPLLKEHDRIERAIYTLSLHLPIGTDQSAVSLHTAIRDELEACMADYRESLQRISEIEEKESLLLSRMLSDIHQNGMVPNGEVPVIEFHAPSPSQIQLQERLYSNQWVMRALEPNQRQGNLSQLVEMLKARISGDKEVISLFGTIRSRNKFLSDSDAVEPWLRKYKRAVEHSIVVIKDIGKDQQLNVVQDPPSPTEAELSSSLEDGSHDLLAVPVLQIYPDEPNTSRLLSIRRASAAIPALCNIEEDMDKMARRYSVPPPGSQQRPRSTSPMKFLRATHLTVRGANGVTTNGRSHPENGSCKSLNSSRSSSRSLNGRDSSSSIHDLNQELEAPTQAFRRAQSLKTKGRYAVSLVTPLPPPPLLQVAGHKKAEPVHHHQSSSNLTVTQVGTPESKPSKLRNLFRSGSAGLVTRCDTQQQVSPYNSSSIIMMYG